MRKSSLFNLFTLAIIAFIVGASGVVAQNLTGDWTADTKGWSGPKNKKNADEEPEIH